MNISVPAPKTDASRDKLSAGMRISSEYKEKTFLIGRYADFLNGDLSKEVAITYKQYRGDGIEISAGDYHFYFVKDGKNTLETITKDNRIKTGKNILQPPKAGESDGQEYIRGYMLGLIGYMAKKEKFELSDGLKNKICQIKGLYAHPLSTTEGFLVSDGAKQRLVTYTQFINKNKGDISILVPGETRAEPIVYLRVPIEMAENGSTIKFRCAPIYPVSMKHNGDPGLSEEGYAAMECIFSTAKFIMARDGKRLKCIPEYLDETAKKKFGVLLEPENVRGPDHTKSVCLSDDTHLLHTEENRIKIRGMLDSGMTSKDIATALKKSISTVNRFLAKEAMGKKEAMKKETLEILQLRENEASLEEISHKTGIPTRTISTRIASYRKQENLPPAQTAIPESERVKIQDMRFEGMTVGAIAAELQNSTSSVYRYSTKKGIGKEEVMKKETLEILWLRRNEASLEEIKQKTGLSRTTIFRRVSAYTKQKNQPDTQINLLNFLKDKPNTPQNAEKTPVSKEILAVSFMTLQDFLRGKQPVEVKLENSDRKAGPKNPT
jgi:hypothetical protein